ncbi:MAG: endonuclease/exonuclease/phosphatase family protein [Myxococcota bacterium]
MTILPADANLSEYTGPDEFSVLSYNILLPNAVDGWWIYKSYEANTPDSFRAWPHRQKLLANQLLESQADIICLQECSAESFDADFAFLLENGYEVRLHRKYRFRCATFWRREKFRLFEERQRDRTLLTSFQPMTGSPDRMVHVVNAHLSGGPAPERRFRQIFDVLDTLKKRIVRRSRDPQAAAVVLCGDFNSVPGENALERLLHGEIIHPDYRDPAYPDRVHTSKPRDQAFGRFIDTYLEAYGSEDARPPTFIVRNHMPKFVTDQGTVKPAALAAFRAIFDRFSNEDAQMGPEGIDAWLTAINRRPDRGSERRHVDAILEEGGRDALSFQGFLTIYVQVLRDRKFWSADHDLQVLGITLPPNGLPPTVACLDRMTRTQALRTQAVRASLSDAQHAAVFEGGDALPNKWHPSDHLPLAAVFGWAD